MRLTAAGGRHRVPRKRSCISRRRSIGRCLVWSRGGLSADAGQQRIAGGNVAVAGSAHGVDDMGVRRHLRHRQRDGLSADLLAELVGRQPPTGALAKRDAAAQIGERKRHRTVAAIGGSDHVEQRGVVRDRQQSAVAQGPADRRKIACEYHDLTDKRTGHPEFPIIGVATQPLGRTLITQFAARVIALTIRLKARLWQLVVAPAP